MNIYGDLSRLEHAVDVWASVMSSAQAASEGPAGIGRHAALVRAFIRASELVQGIADSEFECRGFDGRSALQDRGASLLLDMAAMIDRSWKSSFTAHVDVRRLTQYADLSYAGWIRTRTAEGFAHYALYPESYLEAARVSALGPTTRVIGIRSIGTGLAALVAVALGARPAITVRPVGHPFSREVCVVVDGLDLNSTTDFAVVDEGPGRSGSSLASVACWLAREGVALERIHFFPSHKGEPGGAATKETRLIWKRCRRHPAAPEQILEQGLRSWVECRLGPLERPLEKVATTGNRPWDGRFERCKFLARNSSGPWLIKFAGLGEMGARKLRDAEAMAAAGYGPAVSGESYGFLVQKWVEAKPLKAAHYDRGTFLRFLGSYLAFRATRLGSPGVGASLEALRRMAIENTSEVLGVQAKRKIELRLSNFDALGARVRRVRTDNRLHTWEWLAGAHGFLKIDAVDHCEAHDLIGCQDIAWDVAGCIVEHDLTAEELPQLYLHMKAAGKNPDAGLVADMLPAYLAFQLGLWSTASGSDAHALAQGYARKLSHLLMQ